MDARETTRHHQHRSRTPSFSSSLLDAICRSIDESNDQKEPELISMNNNNNSKQSNSSSSSSLFFEDNIEEVPSLRRAIMIDKWKENRSNSSRRSRHLNSNSSSSDSSCGGIFSSSETDSSSKSAAKSSVSKQSRTCMFVRSERSNKNNVANCEQIHKREGRFMRSTKSRALKIYGDLKKVKQPISPGGRITTFLNSLFSSRNNNVKNTKVEDEAMEEEEEDMNSIRKSRSVKDSITTDSSFSRSCLSNNKSRSSNGLKRSVRFCPVNIIYEDDPRLMPIQIPLPNTNLKNRQLVEKSNGKRDRFRDYQVKMKSSVSRYEFREFQQEDDDEVESCCSSDLFELENINGAYMEELPVYGTTNLKTNYAIANGLIL